MTRYVYSGLVCAGTLLSTMAASRALGQSPNSSGDAKGETARPRQPSGYFGDLGKYLTIEGVRAEAAKVDAGTLFVDSVNGKKLDQPIPIVVLAYAFDRTRFDLPTNCVVPAKQRCVLKGFETGSMIGVPLGVREAAKELGRDDVPMSPADWQWQPYFVALVVVEPKGTELLPKR